MPFRSRRHKRDKKSRYQSTIGKPPGSVVHVGEVHMERPTVTLFDYDAEHLTEISFESIDASRDYRRNHRLLWLNVHGLNDTAAMQEIGRRFGLHPLVLEDIANTTQRPKLEDYGDYLFIVLRLFRYVAEEHDACSDQVSLILGKDFVLSFQEKPSGLFEPIRDRLRKGIGHLRGAGSDALIHALLDAVVDPYFLIVESLGDDVEALEENVVAGGHPRILEDINHFKRETLEIRRAIWPTREVVNALLRQQGFISAEVQLYMRDVYDHSVHVIEQLDALRELIGDLLDIHLTAVSNRLNAEVRVLTVVTTLFAPATLITGFFGMNFQTMPLIEKHDGWLIALGIIGGAAVTMALLFWRRRWLRG